ncbi:uncharacterized protein LOC115552719, partial [Gadus morhua]
MERDSVETSGPGGSGASQTGYPAAGSAPAGQRFGARSSAPGFLQRVQQKVLQGALVLGTLFLLLWAASFIYGSFYYSFMPKAAHSAPVHYYYRSDCEPGTLQPCSYPIANVSLLQNGKHQMMSLGQKYRISLELEMPDSPTNHLLGMFMVRMTCYSKERGRVSSSTHRISPRPSASSTRFTMLRYRSDLLRTFATLLFLPGFLSGVSQQAQWLEVDLFTDYTDDPFSPSVEAMLEVLSSQVQIYSARLNIYAEFTGIRYLLFHYPVMSALVGVSSNLLFLSMLLFISYMRLVFGGTGTTSPKQSGRSTTNKSHTSGCGGRSATGNVSWPALGETSGRKRDEQHLLLEFTACVLKVEYMEWTSYHPLAVTGLETENKVNTTEEPTHEDIEPKDRREMTNDADHGLNERNAKEEAEEDDVSTDLPDWTRQGLSLRAQVRGQAMHGPFNRRPKLLSTKSFPPYSQPIGGLGQERESDPETESDYETGGSPAPDDSSQRGAGDALRLEEPAAFGSDAWTPATGRDGERRGAILRRDWGDGVESTEERDGGMTLDG